MMPTFRYGSNGKLVRDNVPDMNEVAGHAQTVEELEGTALIQALADKLREEIDELPIQKVADGNVLTELADLQEVIDALRIVYGISEEDLREAQAKKRAKKGGLTKGFFITQVTVPLESDPMTGYYRNDPTKYPEVTSEEARE